MKFNAEEPYQEYNSNWHFEITMNDREGLLLYLKNSRG
jgi:hypothetical protein